MSIEPRVRYAITSDGVRIAYSVFGDGPPLVVPPLLLGSHLQLEWDVASRRASYEQLARRATVIRYEARGLGMSQRVAADFSDTAATRDLQAVCDAAGVATFSLFVHTTGGVVPQDFMLLYPERISHVACWVYSRDDRTVVTARLRKLDFLMDEDWELYTDIRALVWFGWSSTGAEAMSALIRATYTPETLRAADEILAARRWPGGLRTAAPLLLLHEAGNVAASRFAGRLAGDNPLAQILAIPAPARDVYGGELAVAAVHEFVARSEQAELPQLAAIAAGAGVQTILFTDLVGHTEMMQRLGDEQGRDVLREHERLTRDLLKEYGGTEVKTMGDAFMASFDSAHQALTCSVELQRAFTTRDIHGERLQVRAGLNAGEPVAEAGDLFGSCVILASRAAASAGAGEILVTDVVRQLAAGKGFTFADRGAAALKGFDEPIRFYEMRWRK
ncbi:MAG: adenylate/guanylate cyclase domain-containing protein [Chloroflexota bacterium]|nr:adenylate/guanylate cyclase domain-containing protein [Chloroflexota bacterium]